MPANPFDDLVICQIFNVVVVHIGPLAICYMIPGFLNMVGFYGENLKSFGVALVQVRDVVCHLVFLPLV